MEHTLQAYANSRKAVPVKIYRCHVCKVDRIGERSMRYHLANYHDMKLPSKLNFVRELTYIELPGNYVRSRRYKVQGLWE